MGWAVGYDTRWNRDIGYGVPAYCDFPGCNAEINRGLAFVCCDQQPYGGDHGCGRFYCDAHATETWSDDGEGDEMICSHADDGHISQDHPDWIAHKLTDESWGPWRDENPDDVAALRAQTNQRTER